MQGVRVEGSFNRTIVELKCEDYDSSRFIYKAFNRTIVELKFVFRCSSFNEGLLLIVP